MFHRYQYNIKDILRTFIFAGLLHSAFSILAFLIPGLQAVFIDMVEASAGINARKLNLESRMYGISSILTFSMPVFQAVLAILVL